MVNLILYEKEIDIRISVLESLSSSIEIGRTWIASSKSEIINKLWFVDGAFYGDIFEYLIIGLDSSDTDILNFVGFIMRNKPEIQIFLYATNGGKWIESLPMPIDTMPPLVKTSIKTINTDFSKSFKERSIVVLPI